jgi:S-formylglutathione hydrolase FrmB
MDFAERSFNFNNTDKSVFDTQLFGFGVTRRKKDPFHLIRVFKPGAEGAPLFFIACGQQDGLIDVNRAFAKRLNGTSIPHLYREDPGGHNWAYWGNEAPRMMSALADALASQKK